MPPDTRRNCRDCTHFRRTEQGPRCRFRGGKPSGICAVFSRRDRPDPNRPPPRL